MPKVKSLKLNVLIALLLFTATAPAITFVQTNEFVIAETNTLTEETWVSAQTLNISGIASNDLFATAPNIELNGTFHGDAWCMGNSISEAGVFHSSTRLISRIAQIQGTHYGSVMAAANTVKIDRTAVLYDDLLCLGENVIIEGSISGKVRVLAQRITLGGQIKDDISIAANEIVVLPGTIILGNLNYKAPDELLLPPSVVLNGTMERLFDPAPARQLLKKNLPMHFMFALAALVTGLVFIGIFPRYTGTTLHLLRESRGLCSLAGFAGLVVLPMGAFFLLFTLIGIPLSLVIFLFYFILLYLGKIAIALWIGSAILHKRTLDKRNAAAPLALGLLIIYALTSITAAEMLINLLVIILGLGALLVALFKKPTLVIPAPEAANKIN